VNLVLSAVDPLCLGQQLLHDRAIRPLRSGDTPARIFVPSIAITSNATPTSQHRSICRDDETPGAYA
jgi:hypothetical protein